MQIKNNQTLQQITEFSCSNKSDFRFIRKTKFLMRRKQKNVKKIAMGDLLIS
jgi:hypothetical protein